MFIGNFYFDAGINETHGKLVLSNLSKYSNKIVTADAARFGGGMGNIGRKPQTEELPVNVKSSSQESTNTVKMFTKDKFTVSGRARYLEGARYWLQWAGVPLSV